MDKMELPLLKGKDREKFIPASVIVGLILMLVIFLLAMLSLTFKGTYKLHYSDNSNLDYKVYLKENTYYPEKYLGKDQNYISSLIDYIDADFSYSFRSNDNLGLEYSYYVTAAVNISNNDGKSIYNKEEKLVERQKFTDLSNKTFRVSENVKIDYDKYNKLAKSFIDTYSLSADANLVVKLYVDLNGKHAEFDKKISDNAVITLSIPLTNKTTEIDMDYDLSNSKDEVLQYRQAIITNKPLFIFAVVLAVLDVAGIAAIIYWIVKNRDGHTVYAKKLGRILKDYERYISETAITERVEDMMKTRSLRIEVVKTFDGLIDIRDNLGKPILYHEERPGEEAVFYIITDRIGYIYVMRASEMGKNARIPEEIKPKTKRK